MTYLKHIGISAPLVWALMGCTVNYGAGSGSLNYDTDAATNVSSSGTTIPGASQILDSAQNVWTVSSGSVLKNGSPAGSISNVALLLYYDGVVFASNSSGSWVSWNGNLWATNLQDPRISANGTTGDLIVDSDLNTWSLMSSTIDMNGAPSGSTPTALTLLYYNNKVYYENSNKAWYVWSGTAWTSQTADPRATLSWFNSEIPTQKGEFTFEFDAIPLMSGATGENSVIGLSPAAASVYTNLAVIVAFQPNGTINVINGAAYANDVAITFEQGESYHVEMDINITSDTYSVYVTPAGGQRTAIATNYAFRSTEATASALAYFANYSLVGGILISNANFY